MILMAVTHICVLKLKSMDKNPQKEQVKDEKEVPE